jgi:hypothetical protein
MNDWETFYAQMEREIAGYKRPEDWEERAKRQEKRTYKPVRLKSENDHDRFE